MTSHGTKDHTTVEEGLNSWNTPIVEKYWILVLNFLYAEEKDLAWHKTRQCPLQYWTSLTIESGENVTNFVVYWTGKCMLWRYIGTNRAILDNTSAKGGYVFAGISLSLCLSVFLLATLLKKLLTDCDGIFREGQKWHKDQLIWFWQISRLLINIK